MGVVSVLMSWVALLKPTTMWISVLGTVLFIALLYIFTKRRALSYGGGEEGFSYGQGLKYIFYMMLFGGVLFGAWEIVARNVLFTEKYEEALSQSLAIMENAYPADMFDMMVSMSKKVMFSPLWVVFGAIVGLVVKGVFFGLFVAAFTRRNPDVFAEEPKNDAE